MTNWTITTSAWQKDQISLSNIQYFSDPKSFDTLIFFVNNVTLNKQSKESQFAFRKVKFAFQNVQKSYGIKAIAPYRTLLLRMFDANAGFTELHQQFLQICYDLNAPAEALPILEYPALFKSMNKTQICNFLILASDLYCQLRNYSKALQLLTKATKLELSQMALIRVYPKITVLLISQGKAVPPEIKFGMKRVITQFEDPLIMSTRSQKDNNIIASLGYFYNLNLSQWRKLAPQHQAFLISEGLYEPYTAGKWKSLGNYITKEIKLNNWRIKASQIKGAEISDLEIIKGINQDEQIYRYDTKEQIMYFNHKKCDQNQLNDLITLAFNMQKQASECKIEKKEIGGGMDFGGFSRGFGGLGGTGSMGMGGMSLGGFGGMRRGGMGRRDEDDEEDYF